MVLQLLFLVTDELFESLPSEELELGGGDCVTVDSGRKQLLGKERKEVEGRQERTEREKR